MDRLKKRIRLYQPLNGTTLTELVKLELIKAKQFIIAAYKDFESWDRVQEGDKLLILTDNALIYVVMKTASSGERMECRLSYIDKLRILPNLAKRDGSILAIGTKFGQYLRVVLDGGSYEDSPEQFLSLFFTTLDEVLLQVPKERRTGKRETALSPARGGTLPGIRFRQVSMPFTLEGAAQFHSDQARRL